MGRMRLDKIIHKITHKKAATLRVGRCGWCEDGFNLSRIQFTITVDYTTGLLCDLLTKIAGLFWLSKGFVP